MGELSLSVESLFGLHSRIMQLTYLKTHLTASFSEVGQNT